MEKLLKSIGEATAAFSQNIEEIKTAFNLKQSKVMKVSIKFKTDDDQQFVIVSDGVITGYE